MKERIAQVGVLLLLGSFFFALGNISSQDKSFLAVVVGGFLAAITALSIELLRAEREEKFRREDRAMTVAKSISKTIFHIQNTNYVASLSGTLTPNVNDIAMHALADLEEARAVAVMFLGDIAGNVIADMTRLLSKVVGEIHQKRGTDFDIKECHSFMSLADKHSEMMQMLKNYAEGRQRTH